jgi:hypothetical protein
VAWEPGHRFLCCHLIPAFFRFLIHHCRYPANPCRRLALKSSRNLDIERPPSPELAGFRSATLLLWRLWLSPQPNELRRYIFSLSAAHFFWAPLRANSCVRQLRGFCFPGSSRTSLVPPIKQPLALGAAASRFWVPQGMGHEKGKDSCLTYMLSGLAPAAVCLPKFQALKHGLCFAGHSRNEACDAAGGAFRQEWRE